ncbi:MAG: SDR family NAD(P)-dependent oxidoreductase [Caldilineaceae bacterium]
MPTVLIIGASGGIGRALAVEYARAGARVLGVGRRPFPPALAGHIQPDDYCTVDLGSSDAAALVQRLLDARGLAELDILVHNAAVGCYGPAAQQTGASIDELLTVNLYAPIALTHALLPRMRAAQGVIAFVSSLHSVLPTPEFAVYTATKAALDGFARNLRLEEAGAADVAVLWPGPTRTEMHRGSGVPQDRIKAARYAAPEDVARQMVAAIPRRHSRATSRAGWCPVSVTACRRLPDAGCPGRLSGS